MLRNPIPVVLVVLYSSPTSATAQLDWNRLPAQDPLFAQMVTAIEPTYHFRFGDARDRTVGRLYLLSAVPVGARAVAPGAQQDLSSERPAAGLLTSFFYGTPPVPTPIEHVLVHARRLSPDSLAFRCELFTSTRRERRVCDGVFELRTGGIAFRLLDLMLDRTEEELRRSPNPDCVGKLHQVDRGRNECSSLGPIDNLRCSISSFLFARHECRTAA